MSNLLIISAVFPPEPVVSASLSRDLAEELSQNHQVTVLCPMPTRPHGFEFGEISYTSNYKVHRLNSYTCGPSSYFGRLRESVSFGIKCCNYIKTHHLQIDTIYMNAWALFAQYLIVRTAKRFHKKVLTHVQDIYPESLFIKLPQISFILNMLLLPLDKYVLQKASVIIAISDRMKNYLSKTRKVPHEKISVIHNWQDEDVFMQFNKQIMLNPKVESRFIFMYLGNLGPVAGIDFLIDAFVKAGLPDCKLVIAGSGSKKAALQKKCADLQIGNIEFWSVPDDKVPEIQYQADVLLLPIKKGAASTSIPSKLPAYMFSHKPIIACVDDCSDTANAVKESGCGWVLDSENMEQLVEKMKQVVCLSKDELHEKGKLGFNFAFANYSRKSNLPKIVEIFNNTINK